MTKKLSNFTCLLQSALLIVKLNMVTPPSWHLSDTDNFPSNFCRIWTFDPQQYMWFLHQTTILSSAFVLPLPNASRVGSRVRWFSDETPASKTYWSHALIPWSLMLQHLERLLSWPQSPRIPPQRCRPWWPSSGWRLPARPARCPGCTGWCHRWSSHTLSVQGPCPWKDRVSQRVSIGLKFQSPLPHWWARSPVYSPPHSIVLFKELISDPCWAMPLCKVHVLLNLTLGLTLLIFGGKDMVLPSMSGWSPATENETIWTFSIPLLGKKKKRSVLFPGQTYYALYIAYYSQNPRLW